MPFPEFESGHKDAPFSRNAQEIAELYFPGADTEQIGNFTVVSGSENSHILIQELKIFEDSNSNGIYDPGELVYENYNLFIFVASGTAQLQEAFDNFKPEPNDVCIFVEDNSTDIFSGTTASIRQSKSTVIAGPKIRDELSQWFSGDDDSTLDQLRNVGEQLGFEIDLSKDEMATLIREGEVRDAGMYLFISIVQLFNGLNILAAPLYKEIATLLSGITTFCRENFEFKDYHWDPQALIPKGKEGELVENTGFEPVLLPLSHSLIDELASLEDAGVQIVTDKIRRELDKKRKSLQGKLSKINNLKTGGAVTVSQGIQEFADRAGALIDDLMRRMANDFCEKIVPLYVSYSKSWLNAVNAFNCGLWNALVEAVLGFVDLLVAGLNVFAFVGNSLRDAQALVPQTLEIIDELIQAFLDIDFMALSGQLFSSTITMLSKINMSAFFAGLSAERIAYFLGFLIGFVVQTIVEILYSGGSTKLVDTIEKFGKIADSVYGFVTQSVNTAIRVSKNAWENLIALVRKIIEVMKKGGDELVKMYESILELVIKGGMLSEDVVAQIFRRFGISPAERKSLEDLGIRFVSDVDGVATACNIFNVAQRI